jgi:hypothetical protein
MNYNFITAVLLILFAAFSRILPHPANFAPIAAIALFSGVYLNKRIAFAVPIIAMFISDLIIGLHSGMMWVYGSFIIITFLGLWLREKITRRDGSVTRLGVAYLFGTTLASSVIFFIITNFGVWTSGFYGFDLKGLAECYTLAIPFFRNSLLGDLVYVTLMFGIYELIFHLTPKGETDLRGAAATKQSHK